MNPSSVFADDPYFKIKNMDVLNELSSNTSDDWNVTESHIDTKQYYLDWKDAKIDNIPWKKGRIPGNLSGLISSPFPEGTRVYLKKEFILPDDWKTEHFSLYIERVSDRDRTYLNGELIGSTGMFESKKPEALIISRIYDIPESLLNKGGKNLIIIEIEPYFDNEIGLLRSEIKLGPSSMIYSSFYIKDRVKVFISLIYFFIGIIFLYIFIFRRDRKQYMFYALFNIFFSIQQFSNSQIIYDYIPSKIIIWHLPYIFLPPVFSFFSHFIRLYFEKPYNLLHKILDLLLFILFFIIILFNDLKIDINIWRNIQLPLSIVYIVLSIYILVVKFIEKHPDSKFMLISFTLLLPAVVLDILSNLSYIILPQMISPFFILSFDVSLAIILSIHIEKIRKDVKDLNTNLEEKVNQRTIEIKNSIEKIKNLKNKEDNLHYFIGNKLKNSVDEIKELTQVLLQLEFIENEDKLLVLNKMYYESNELFLTLQKLISWTLIQKNQEYGELSNFLISEILSKEINFYRDLANRKGITLNLTLRDGNINSNKEKIIFMVREILSNSLNSSESGGIVDLNISGIADSLDLIISHEDSNNQFDDSKNINLEIGDLLSENSNNKFDSLGLLISKLYAISLGGKFEIQSNIEKRTTINITIPLKV